MATIVLPALGGMRVIDTAIAGHDRRLRFLHRDYPAPGAGVAYCTADLFRFVFGILLLEGHLFSRQQFLHGGRAGMEEFAQGANDLLTILVRQYRSLQYHLEFFRFTHEP